MFLSSGSTFGSLGVSANKEFQVEFVYRIDRCTFCLLDSSEGEEGVCLFKSRIRDVSVSSESLVVPVKYHL